VVSSKKHHYNFSLMHLISINSATIQVRARCCLLGVASMRTYDPQKPDFIKMIAMSLFAAGCLIWLVIIIAPFFKASIRQHLQLLENPPLAQPNSNINQHD